MNYECPLHLPINRAKLDAADEFMNRPAPSTPASETPTPEPSSDFQTRAATLLARGVPIIPLQPNSKGPSTAHAAYDGTTDPDIIAEWVKTYDPASNCGAVARYDGFWMLDDDLGTLAEEYKRTTGEDFPTTFTVSTARGFHYYFRHDEASRQTRYNDKDNSGVIAVPGYKGECRCNNQYVVSPDSIHPSGARYTICNDAQIVSAPATLLAWLQDAFTRSETQRLESREASTAGGSGSDSGFGKLFDAVGYQPLVRRINALPDARLHIKGSLTPGHTVVCPLPHHEHETYTHKNFGPMKEKPYLLHCLGNCKWSGDMVAACFYLDGGKTTHRNMYDCARAICKEEGLTFEDFFPAKPVSSEYPSDAEFANDQPPDVESETCDPNNDSGNSPPKLFEFAQKPSELSDKPIEWVIDEMFPKNSLSLVCGREGIGKGVHALLSAAAILNGGLFLGRKANAVPHVLYVDMENPEAVVRERLARLGLLESENFHIWGQWSPTPPSTHFDDAMYMEYATKTGGFIFFDSLVDFCNGAEENNPAEMNAALTKARFLARRCAGVHIQHHSDKYGKSGFRGTTAITAAVDMAFGLRAEDDEAFRKGTDRTICFSTLKPKMCKPYHLNYEITGWDGRLAYRLVADDGEATLDRSPEQTASHKGPTKGEVALRIGRDFVRGKLGRQLPVSVGNLKTELERNACKDEPIRYAVRTLRAQFETHTDDGADRTVWFVREQNTTTGSTVEVDTDGTF